MIQMQKTNLYLQYKSVSGLKDAKCKETYFKLEH